MDIFIARQGIYNLKEKIVAYELLYRNSMENKFIGDINEDKATYKLIENINAFGLDKIIDNKIAFINFTEGLIKNNMWTLLPKEKVVIEILENVLPTQEVLYELSRLKTSGYTIALDDLENIDNLINFVNYIDIVKIDFILSTKKQREKISYVCKRLNIKIVAEKIETKEDFDEAVKLGCEYFQGYYFSRPAILLGKDLEVKNISIINILMEIIDEDYDIDRVEEVMKADVALTYKFFKFINSSYFSFLQKIESIKQSIMLIGKKELRKWLLILTVSEIINNKNEEYEKNIIIRAKFIELIAQDTNNIESSSAFIVGLFSDLHLMINEDMQYIVDNLPLNQEIKNALKGEENIYKSILDLALAYENLDSKKISMITEKIGINKATLINKYYLAIEWCEKIVI